MPLSYFPAFLNLENKKILIIGGGKIAFEKVQKLLPFSSDIMIIAKEFSSDMDAIIQKHSLKNKKQAYSKEILNGFDIVIAAVDDLALQKRIYGDTRMFHCLFNAVDFPQFCDFIFPAYVKRGDLTVAISTGGSSPAFAKAFRIWLEKTIPDDIETFLEEMKALRSKLPKGKERMEQLQKKAQNYIKGWKRWI